MEDELWLKKIKDKLEDYSEPLPVAGWERLEKELSVSGAPITGPHRMIPFRRWAVAAAAVLLVAVSSVSLWLLQSPVGNEMRHTSVPALAVAPDATPRPKFGTNSPSITSIWRYSTFSFSNTSIVACRSTRFEHIMDADI